MAGSAWCQVVPNNPSPDGTLQPPLLEVEAEAKFGFSMAMGKLGVADPRDDVVVAAINNDEGTFIDVGAAYTFLDTNLQPAGAYSRLVPDDLRDDIQMGRLRIAIGDVRGGGLPNLAFLGGPARDRRFVACNPPVHVTDLGGVDVFDFTHPTDAHAALIIPPGDPVAPPGVVSCYPQSTTYFGHSLAIGDVDGDGIDDLVVGAHRSDNVNGRVYILFGHSSFLSNPWQRFLVLKSPGLPTYLNFGVSVATELFDSDAKAEVIVEMNSRAANLPNVGRTYIISGDWIASQMMPSVVTPPTTAFQEIVNPTGDSKDSFGWQIHAIGDLGNGAWITGSPDPKLDGKPDLAVHAEGADYPGVAGGPCPTPVNQVGAMYIYYGVAAAGQIGKPFVSDTAANPPLALYTPSNVGCPQGGTGTTRGRVGRAAARVEWLSTVDGQTQVHPYLLVAEPNRDVTVGGITHQDAGQVYMLELPIWEGNKNTHMLPAPIVDPTGVQTDGLFGSWIVVGDYKNNPVTFPGQQFVISSREYDNVGASGTAVNAGRAYAFVP